MSGALNTGSFFLQNRTKSGGSLHRYLYEIYNDQKGVFKLYYVYQTTVKELYITAHDVFEDFDCSKLLRGGFGLRLQQQDSPMMEIVFDSKVELKKFCMAVYKFTKNMTMKEYCYLVGWEEEVDLFDECDPEGTTSPIQSTINRLSTDNVHGPRLSTDAKKEFNRVSFLTMNIKSSRSSRGDGHDHHVDNGRSRSSTRSHSRSNSNSPTRPSTGSGSESNRGSPSLSIEVGSGTGGLRREASFSLTLDKMLGKGAIATLDPVDTSTGADEIKQYGQLVFSQACLLLISPTSSSGIHKSKGSSTNSFTRHKFEIFSDGYVVITETKAQIASSAKVSPIIHKCSKFLCFKFESSSKMKEILHSSNFVSKLNDSEMAEVIISLEIHEYSGDSRSSGHHNSSSRVTTAHVIFPSLETSKEFLCAITRCVPVHNVLGYMVDMLWADEEGFINGVRHSLEMKDRTEETTDGDESKSDVDDEVVSNASENDDDQYAISKTKSNSVFRGNNFGRSNSRISINAFNQNCLIPPQVFCSNTLLESVTYDPTLADKSFEVSLLLDGVDLSKTKHFLMIIFLVDISVDNMHDNVSYVSTGSRLLSPLIRRARNEDEQKLENTLKEIKDNIANNSKYVSELSLKYCKLNEKGLFKLFTSLRTNDYLSSLDLCGNAFLSDNTSASLGNFLNFNRTLHTLNAQETMMGNVGATLVAQAMHINKSITSLNLSANKIGPQGCVMLASALKENKSITHLNLSRNVITSRGAQLLAAALHNNTHVLNLDLGRQRLKGKIGQDGAKHFARCLMVNQTLRILRIGRNRLGFEGSRYISGALLTNRTLQVLDISCNKIGIEGAIQIANAVLQNGSLEYVIIGHRRLPICNLVGHFHENRRLTECSFTYNFQDKSNVESGLKSTEHFMAEELEKAFDKELEYDYNVYFANDASKVHSDSVFNAKKADFSCIDFQVLQSQFVEKSRKDEVLNSRPGGLSNYNDDDIDNDAEPPVFSISDEEAVFIAHLIKDNSRLEVMRIDHTFLPIQKLRGRPFELEIENSGIVKERDKFNLDLSDSLIKCPDAIVIGILIADNPRLKLISLQGNDFCKTEGETWIANALSKNPYIGINTSLWSAEEMYADGYHQLAALKGISASGAAIMPQRLEDWFDRLCLIGGATAYYLDFLSDVYVTYLYSQDPETYQTSWVVISALFLSLPTCMLVYSIVWTTWTRKYWVGALQRLAVVVLQLHPVVHVIESIQVGIETTGYLDTRFLEGVYENIPQIALQTYIMFLVSVRNGEFDLRVFISVIISLASVSGVLVMLVDRGPVRSMCLGPAEHHPEMVKVLAQALTVILVGNYHKSGNMKQLVNYSCHTYAHYFWASILQFTSITVRIVALCWLLSTSEAYKIVVFGLILTIRLFFLVIFDPKLKARPVSKNIIWAVVYTALTVVWDKDESFSKASHKALVILNLISTFENVIFLGYAGFLSADTSMTILQKVMVCLIAIACMAISWYLLLAWMLPVHFPELYSELRSYSKNPPDFKRLGSAKGSPSLRESDFEDTAAVLQSVRVDRNTQESLPIQPIRDSNRERVLELRRQESREANEDFKMANVVTQKSRRKSTWWSSLNKDKSRQRKSRPVLTVRGDDSFTADNPAFGLAITKSPVGEFPDVENGGMESKVDEVFDEEKTDTLNTMKKFRQRTLSSIHSHRSSRHSMQSIGSAGTEISDLTDPSTFGPNRDDNAASKHLSTGEGIAQGSHSQSSARSDIVSGRFEYDNFIAERETTFAPDGAVSGKGNIVISMESPASPTAAESHYNAKKHHMNKFRIGNITGRKNRTPPATDKERDML